MFNFFDALKTEYGKYSKIISKYNLVMVGGNLLYIEGHKGIIKMQPDNITVKVCGGLLHVKGENLFLKELTKNTVCVQGKLCGIEVVWWKVDTNTFSTV